MTVISLVAVDLGSVSMPEVQAYQDIIVGSGEGGKYLAWRLGKQGRRTALIERRWIGGSCPNVNCLPSKNEIWSAKVARLVREGDKYGAMSSDFRIDMAKVRQRKREMVEGLVKMHLDRYHDSGVELIMGNACFVAPKTLEVVGADQAPRRFTAERIFLNLGSHAVIPEVPGLAAADPLTNIEALELDVVPDHLIVLGGSYVGLEFAQAHRRFGARVTVIERADRPVWREDADLSNEVAKILQDEGVAILNSAELLGVEGRSGGVVSVRLRRAGVEEVVQGSHILIAAGRLANTEGAGLDVAGVEIDKNGFIVVNERLQTTAPSIWALGDCAGSPQFTHVSLDDFRVVRDNLEGKDRKTTGRLIPYCMYTDPPMARVGLSETEAAKQGLSVRVARLPMSAVLRTRTTGETEGFMKVLVGADDRILGFAMIGAEAGEVTTIVQTAMLANLPYDKLREAIITHPTVAEGIGQVLTALPPLA
jgi:pyruvate/2-oxoglutarate dehydrogenase complex dihydrolipoamide dehydrogenase (E3) component